MSGLKDRSTFRPRQFTSSRPNLTRHTALLRKPLAAPETQVTQGQKMAAIANMGLLDLYLGNLDSAEEHLAEALQLCKDFSGFLTQMCARFSPQQVSHAVERGCGCARARESAVKSSIAQSTAACTGPAFGGGPARRQPVPPQGAEALAFTGQRTMNTRGTRPGLSPTFYRWAEPSLTVQPLGTGRPLVISAVYRGPDFPRACSSSPDTDGVLQPRKSMTMFDLLAMEPAKAAPIPERNPSQLVRFLCSTATPSFS